MINLANENINSPVVDPQTGYIDFPIVKENATDIFLHNYALFMDRINKVEKDRPKQWLIIGNSDGTKINLTKTNIHDWNYSHEEVRYAANNSEYTHVDTPIRTNYKYGETEVYFMTDNESNDEKGIIINNDHIGFSFDLGKPYEFYPDEYIFRARRMNRYYNLNDIAYTTSRTIPSYIRLRCVKAGVTDDKPFAIERYTPSEE